jgi:hypothetical protein
LANSCAVSHVYGEGFNERLTIRVSSFEHFLIQNPHAIAYAVHTVGEFVAVNRLADMLLPELRALGGYLADLVPVRLFSRLPGEEKQNIARRISNMGVVALSYKNFLPEQSFYP